jgi:hypothetical protein
MSSFVISLVVAIGAATYAWTKLVHGTGNADPKKIILSSGVIGVIVFLFLLSLLKLVLHIN